MRNFWLRLRPPTAGLRSQGWLGFLGFLGLAGRDSPPAYAFFAFFVYFRYFLPPRGGDTFEDRNEL